MAEFCHVTLLCTVFKFLVESLIFLERMHIPTKPLIEEVFCLKIKAIYCAVVYGLASLLFFVGSKYPLIEKKIGIQNVL